MRTGTSRHGAAAAEGQLGLRLGGARADFVAGLGRKVTELRTGLGKVREAPADIARREELRRKLHALASGAKLMKFDAMDRAIADALGMIDRSAIDQPLDAVDMDAIEQILEDLPALAWGDGESRPSRIEAIAKPVVPSYSALVVGPAMIGEALLGSGEGEERATFTCESTPDAQAAFDLARATQPDIVVLDADLDCAPELVDALMDEPVTEASPIVVVGSFLQQGEAARYVAMGVAKTLAKPTSRDALRMACIDALEALRVETCLPVPSEVRVSTSGSGAISLAPLPVVDPARSDRTRMRARGPSIEVRLQGRRVVVADDDPAVVWFIADLLKSAGCTVYEAFDGKQALETAYRTSPDLVVSDILMPEIDGFTLCRSLRRDVAMRDVPVILLSWKEDLLQRVRELGAGAAGYVRKESDTRAILARVREALRPRARIEMRLRDDDGEVRGRMDGISVRTLLEIVCAMRPDARVSIRDASFNYEVEVRCGAPMRATRTAGDGTVLEGSRVLAAMLGIGAGRFTVTTSTSPVEAQLDGNLAAQLAKPIARARASTSLLLGPASTKTSRVILDEDALDDYLRATPLLAKNVARRIADGTPPRALVLEGACDASLVEDLVCDLAARGVVQGIEDDAGVDLLAAEIARLAQHADARASFAPKSATPAPVPADALSAAGPAVAANDCVADEKPLCESPAPGSASIEDGPMRDMFRSPTPAQLGLPLAAVTKTDAAKRDESAASRAEARRFDDEGTPPHDQILALAEPTVVDHATYEERDPSISIRLGGSDGDEDEDGGEGASRSADASVRGATDEDGEDVAARSRDDRADKTPFVAVNAGDEPAAGVPAKRAAWPMVAFVAASGVIAWAVMHFAMAAPASKGAEKTAPPVETSAVAPNGQGGGGAATKEEITYTDVAASAHVASGQGVLDVSAPGDAVVVVDGAERGRGAATLPLWAGAHDVRISGVAGESARAVEVRAGKVAHVRF